MYYTIIKMQSNCRKCRIFAVLYFKQCQYQLLLWQKTLYDGYFADDNVETKILKG